MMMEVDNRPDSRQLLKKVKDEEIYLKRGKLKVKKEISRFTRKLANEDFLEKLLRLKTETDFYKIIEKFEEEK